MRHPDGRSAWWRELVLIAVTYGAYSLTRNTLPTQAGRARRNALDLYRTEKSLHVDIEHALNAFLAAPGVHTLAVLANYTYSVSHFAVTVAVLAWLYFARPRAYRAARTILLLTTLLALLGFWLYPLAPPRFFPQLGFVDTAVRDGTWGSWGSTTVTHISNQYAAMPSVHVAWSLWCAAAVMLCARRNWVRAIAALYPVVIVLVVIATANHWTLDALGGIAALALGASLWMSASRIGRRLRRRADDDQGLSTPVPTVAARQPGLPS